MSAYFCPRCNWHPCRCQCQTKRCSRCREYKPFDQFQRGAKDRFGLYAYCRPCHRIIDRDRTALRRAAYTEVSLPRLERIGWLELERRRLARDPSIRRVSWACQHSAADRSHDYNGIGLRRLQVAA